MLSDFQTQVKAAPKHTFNPVWSGVLQRCTATMECDDCRNKRLTLQRNSVNYAEPSSVPPIVHEVLRSPGQPLDAATRGFMEPRFGHDLSNVRVHTDAKAAESAAAVNALAYTVGRDVVFGAGQHAPQTNGGRKLMAHELTHVVQQGASCDLRALALDDGQLGSPYERQAAEIAHAISYDAPLFVPYYSHSNQILQRQTRGGGGSRSTGSQGASTGSPLLHDCATWPSASSLGSVITTAQVSARRAVQGLQSLLAHWGRPSTSALDKSTEMGLRKGFNMEPDKSIWKTIGIPQPEILAADRRDRAAAQTILNNFSQLAADAPNYLGAPTCHAQLTSGSPCLGCVDASHPRCTQGAKAFVVPQMIGSPSSPIFFCPDFFNFTVDQMAERFLHELAHLQSFASRDYLGSSRYYGCPIVPEEDLAPGLTDPNDYIRIADSYRCFLETQREHKAAYERIERIKQEAHQATRGALGLPTTP